MENDELKKRKLDFDENFKIITEKMSEAAVKSGRDPSEVTLLAATKTVPVELINYATEKGVKLIGENKVQELLSKYDELSIEKEKIHFIGHLQTNKVNQIVGKVSLIESVDSIHLAEEIAKRSLNKNITTDILAEINIGEEESKSGINPKEAEEFIYRLSNIKGINLKGLMAIPPIIQNESKQREFFSNIYKIFIDIQGKKMDNIKMDILSIGMSDDYELAILEGSTQVRIGSLLFGKRNYNK